MMKLKGLMNKEGMKNLFKNKKVVVAVGVSVVIFAVYMYNRLLPEIDMYDDNTTEVEDKE